MSAFSVRIDLGTAQRKLAELVRKTARLRPAFLEIRELLIESTQRRFKEERGPDGQPWQPLSPRTLKSKKKAGSRFPNGILKQSGQMAENIFGEATDTSLTIGSPEVQSAIQQFGGVAGFSSVIPARPFLGLSDDDIRGITGILEDHLSPD